MLKGGFCEYAISTTWADPGFLEKVFICINGWGVHFVDFISFNQISHVNDIIWYKTKLFHFLGYLKTGGGGGGGGEREGGQANPRSPAGFATEPSHNIACFHNTTRVGY